MGDVVTFPRACRVHPLPVQEFAHELAPADGGIPPSAQSPDPIEEVAPRRSFVPWVGGRSRIGREQRRAIRRERKREKLKQQR